MHLIRFHFDISLLYTNLVGFLIGLVSPIHIFIVNFRDIFSFIITISWLWKFNNIFISFKYEYIRRWHIYIDIYIHVIIIVSIMGLLRWYKTLNVRDVWFKIFFYVTIKSYNWSVYQCEANLIFPPSYKFRVRHFQQYFNYIVAVSFIGGGNRSIRRKSTTCRKSLTNLMLYRDSNSQH